jgi:uncharacterized protein YjbI with pentapeptide repeats
MNKIYIKDPKIMTVLEKFARQGQHLRELHFTRLDLSGLNLHGALLIRCKFTDCCLFGVNFAECDFDYCSFTNTTCEGSNFESSKHIHSNFYNVDLTRTNFSKAYFSYSSVAGESTIAHQMNLAGIKVKKNFLAPPDDLLDRFKELGKIH